MSGRFLPLLEFLVVALFAIGWGLLELHTRKLDRERDRRAAAERIASSGTGGAAGSHPGA